MTRLFCKDLVILALSKFRDDVDGRNVIELPLECYFCDSIAVFFRWVR